MGRKRDNSRAVVPFAPNQQLQRLASTAANLAVARLGTAGTVAARVGSVAGRLASPGGSVLLGVAQELWKHRDAIGNGARRLWAHLPSIPRSMTSRALSAPANVGTVLGQNWGYTNATAMTFEGRPGQRVVARGLLGTLTPSVASGGATLNGMFWASGGFSVAAFPFPVDATADPLGLRTGAGKVCIVHPVLMGGRVTAFAQLFCQYVIRHFTVSVCSVVGTGVGGAYSLGLMESQQGQEIREHAMGASIGTIMQLPESNTVPAWGTVSNAVEYNYSGNLWRSCLFANSEVSSNTFVSTPVYWGTDPTVAAGINSSGNNESAAQLFFLAANVGTATGASPTAYLVYDAVIDFKDWCMMDTGMQPIAVSSTPQGRSLSRLR